MDESRYQQLADVALRRIETMLEEVDADDVDIDRSGDVLTLTFASKKKAVINTQRPTRQIWVAANARAWHFGFEEGGDGGGRWVDDKGQGVELFQQIAAIVKESAGLDLVVG
ncbi:MAG: Frataxin CyaY, facilitates iron supply for heme synthesis or Fe-S cluster assembly [Labilithrix sp.]|nr:Frataxin CyaY, facilitates iron supply for heme synthesis or Fe-S cluster assembly [Labilithrix sp.]